MKRKKDYQPDLMTAKEHRIFSFMIFFLMIMLIWLLAGCSDKATRKARRADRLMREAIAAGAELKADTFWTTLEIPVPQVKTDTVFESSEGDTVWIREDRLKIKYVNLPGDSVYIYGEAEADTIYKEVVHTITNEIKCPPKNKTWMWIAIALALIVVSSLALRR